MKTIKDKVKLLITAVIVLLFLWFLVGYPGIAFHKNEKLFEEAARNYFDLNHDELPTGRRVKKVTLETLYRKDFLKKALRAPYTNKKCSAASSWVKVRHENDDYKYYVYLTCGGAMHSIVDHRGPEIKLDGNESIIVNLGDKYEDPGVKSVIDSKDGRLNNTDVITKGRVNPSKIGTYKITYTAVDKLDNKTTVTRTVQVVQKLYQTIISKLGNARNYIGEPTDNYIRLSNMLYRIYGVDDSNVIVVADEDVANVNYSKIDKWLDYYYEHLDTDTQKMIVESQFCNMKVSDTSLDTLQCNSYTSKKKVYIPSIIEVNKANTLDENFMKPDTMSWVSNPKGGKQAYVTRKVFFGDEYGKSFLGYDVSDNYGIRPMMVIKGDSLITGGDGTRSDPYVFGKEEKSAVGDLVNNHNTGEYILDGEVLWRIVDSMDDGTTKVISVTNPSSEISCYPNPSNNKIVYNPDDRDSIAYFINNSINQYVDTSKFVKHTINVPIYKGKIIYGEEIKKQQYQVVLSAPDMYEMFSAQTRNLVGYEAHSYWLINTSKAKNVVGVITDIGVPLNDKVEDYYAANVRVVGYLKKDITISSGKGTEDSPYRIK